MKTVGTAANLQALNLIPAPRSFFTDCKELTFGFSLLLPARSLRVTEGERVLAMGFQLR
jgi:hypothetical protein